MHEKRLRKTGELGPPNSLTAPNGASLEERLRHVGWVETSTGCWEWQGRTNNDGYGWTSQPGPTRNILAHRAAYLAWVGPIESGRIVVRHTCDNPPCINPAHLVLGSDLDNARDAVGRKRNANGERMWSAKLTDAQVEEIRRRYTAGGVSQRALAAEYGVWHQHISELVRGVKRPRATNPRPTTTS